MNIKQVISQPEYEFLETNEHLGNNICFLTFGGSHAYGTNTPTSDIDVRGVVLDRPSDLIGFTGFEQFQNNETDTVIYGFNKFVRLAYKCSPNVIELLGCREDSYLINNEFGKLLLDNADMFLSKIAAKTFGGYATQQLRRLQNAIARDSYPQSEKENHILGSCNNAMMTFSDRYHDIDDYGTFELSVVPSKKEDMDSEIVATINLKDYPIRDYMGMMSELNDTIKNYDKLNQRNKKKDETHLNKHAMHLVRLYLTVFDILEKKQIITYRENDIPLLMSVRNGDYMNEDGTYRKEFFEMITNFEKRLQYASQNTDLPSKPNYKEIEELVMQVNRYIVNYK